MGYIFKYFDDLFTDELSEEGSISPKNLELYGEEEILKNSMEIKEFLRDKYYSETEEHIIIRLFQKLFRRLVYLLKLSNEIIQTKNEELIFYYERCKDQFKEYDTILLINREMMYILELFLDEFNLKAVEGFECKKDDYKSMMFREHVFSRYNFELVNFLRHGDEISNEFIRDFPNIAKNPAYIIANKKSILDVFNNPYSFIKYLGANIERKFLQPFYNLELLDLPRIKGVHQRAITFIKRKISLIEEEEEKKRFIVSFYIHIGCCKDVIVEYVSDSLSEISNTTSKNRNDKINDFIEWYDSEVRFPKYDNYLNTFCESKSIEISKEIEDILRRYRIESLSEQLSIANEIEVNGDKIEYTGTLESLGLLTNLYFESNLFKKHNNVERTARVLANSFNAENKDGFDWTTVKGYFKNRRNDDKNVPFLIDKLSQMLTILEKIKKDYNYK